MKVHRKELKRRKKATQRKQQAREWLASGKRRIQRRLDRAREFEYGPRVFRGGNVRYEPAGRARGLSHGGIGLMHEMVQHIGLADAIDRRVSLLKLHLPYHESDHVLNVAYNVLCDGRCLEDIELRRNDEVYLDALGAERIPDPTTAGDFCRRFQSEAHIQQLQEAIHEARQNVWREQPAEFFEEAVIDMDGSLVETTGECKQGMDISYNGQRPGVCGRRELEVAAGPGRGGVVYRARQSMGERLCGKLSQSLS